MLLVSTCICYKEGVAKDSAAAKRTYHHGDLKRTLLEAALEVIRDVGHQSFTLREVARRAGVSHNAPYRHFRDKEHLLATVAAQGFERLEQYMADAARPGRTAMERLHGSGRGYVAFALAHPEHFAVMFERTTQVSEDEIARTAGMHAFQALVAHVTACQADGTMPPGDPLPMALVAWSAVHGIAKLAIAKNLPFGSVEEIIAFTRVMTDVIERGASAFGKRRRRR